MSGRGLAMLNPYSTRLLREQERQRAEEVIAQLEQERQCYQALVKRLRERGIEPEQL